MNVPKTIKIGAHKVRLVSYKAVIADVPSGESDRGNNVLKLDVHQKPSAVLTTLLHEINHMVNSEWDHQHLEFVAQAYAQIFIDNPQLVDVIRWLVKAAPQDRLIGIK